ncbi:MAG: hypothetical protein MZV70_20035 [Desulfobacterales bacterium]|nr:hypothetical protein [Desulfobacterales bacterium]
MVKTSPIRNAEGEVVAAMEVNLDITHLKRAREDARALGEEVPRDLQQHPQPGVRPGRRVPGNPRLQRRACRRCTATTKSEILNRCFVELFPQGGAAALCRQGDAHRASIHQARQIHKDGRTLFVDMWISPGGIPGPQGAAGHHQRHHQAPRSRAAAHPGQQDGHPGGDGDRRRPRAQPAAGRHQDRQPVFHQEGRATTSPSRTTSCPPCPRRSTATSTGPPGSSTTCASSAARPTCKLDAVSINDVLQKAFEIFSQQLKAARHRGRLGPGRPTCRRSMPMPTGWSRCSSTC